MVQLRGSLQSEPAEGAIVLGGYREHRRKSAIVLFAVAAALLNELAGKDSTSSPAPC